MSGYIRRIFTTLVVSTVFLGAPAMADKARTKQPPNTLSPLSFSPDTVTIHIDKQCMLGDFDAIRHDMMYAGIPRLLLSIQAIDSEAEATQVVYSKLDGLSEPKTDAERQEQGRRVEEYLTMIFSEGETASLHFPPTEVGYIIRLCKDSSQTNTCAKKPVASISNLLEKLAKVEPGYVSPDVVYFYQPMIKAREGLVALEASFQESDAATIQKLLSEAHPSVSSETALDIVQGLSTTRSFPISDADQRLTLHLPMYSKEKCTNER